MLELNYVVLEDALRDKRVTKVREVLIINLRKYIAANRKFTRAKSYDDDQKQHLSKSLEVYEAELNEAIDAAFSSLTILKKEYRKLAGGRVFDGTVGVKRAECTDEEWVSFRPEKADVLDDVSTYLTLRLEEHRKVN